MRNKLTLNYWPMVYSLTHREKPSGVVGSGTIWVLSHGWLWQSPLIWWVWIQQSPWKHVVEADSLTIMHKPSTSLKNRKCYSLLQLSSLFSSIELTSPGSHSSDAQISQVRHYITVSDYKHMHPDWTIAAFSFATVSNRQLGIAIWGNSARTVCTSVNLQHLTRIILIKCLI